MTETPIGIGVLNRPAARFVAIGLFLMAFFTALWASWSFSGLSAFLGVALIVIFGAFAVIFVINGVQLFRSAAQLPLPAGAESQRRGRALRVGFGVTFASEGVVIAVVCALLAINGGYAYFAPAIALIVGLHFIPFGFLFRRRVDFYIAAWVGALGHCRYLADCFADFGGATGGIARRCGHRLRDSRVRHLHVAGQTSDHGSAGRIGSPSQPGKLARLASSDVRHSRREGLASHNPSGE